MRGEKGSDGEGRFEVGKEGRVQGIQERRGDGRMGEGRNEEVVEPGG